MVTRLDEEEFHHAFPLECYGQLDRPCDECGAPVGIPCKDEVYSETPTTGAPA